MSFLPTAEHISLRASARDLFAAHAGSEARRSYVDEHTDHDPRLWKLMAELGFQGMTIPEQHGGAGASLLDIAMVLQEAGSALVCSPFFASSVLAATAVVQTGDDAAMSRILPPIATGESIVSLVFRTRPQNRALTATVSGSAYRLDGDATHVVDGCAADHLVVIANTSDGPSLFLADRSQGVRLKEIPPLDPTRRLADVEFRSTPATMIGSPGSGDSIIDRTLTVAQVALATEQVGAAQRCLDMAIDYAKTRVQFARQLASFQVIKHQCADMFVDVQSARSVALHAAWALDADPETFDAASRMTAALVSDAFYRTAAQSMQIHGAIGFTWEHDAHLYLKRAISSARLLRTPRQHRDATAAAVGL